VIIALVILLFLDEIQRGFLAVAEKFDREGSVRNPDWLARPIVTVAGILLTYAALRFAFTRMRGGILERWVLSHKAGNRLRISVLAVTFIGIPLLFGSFAYAMTHPRYFAAYYGEDRLFENVTALLLILGGSLMLAAAISLLRSAVPMKPLLAAMIAPIGVATIVLGLEEISYGQRIMGWETPATMRDTNLQAETNLHNYWTHDVQAAVLWLIGILIFIGTAVSALLRATWLHPWTDFLPDQSFLPYAAALLLLVSHAAFHELLEQVVAVAAFLYACQVLGAARKQLLRARSRSLQD
jgi:hypothetical protein